MKNEDTVRERRTGGLAKPFWIAGAILALIGIVAFAIQMANQSMAGVSQYPWGFYIAMFYSAASAGAGILIVGGIAYWSGFIKELHMARLYVIACALFIVASILIVVDLGSPLGILMTYTSANALSPVFFDALVLPLCIVVCVVAALVVGSSQPASKIVSAVGLLAGLALLGVEAWLLTTCSGKEAWSVLLGAGPALIQSALLAIAVIVAGLPESRAWKTLLLGTLIVVLASLVFDVVLNQGSGTILQMQLAAIAAMPLFWIATVIGLIACVLLFTGGSKLLVRCAVVAAIATVPLFKLAIFWGTQSVAPIKELTSGGVVHFDPIELVVFAGAIGFGMLVYAIADRILRNRKYETKEVQA